MKLVKIMVIVAIIVLGWWYKDEVSSYHFVDENDNFVIGERLLEGDKIYEKLFSHHLPGAYIGSFLIQEVSRVNNVFMLVKRHREAVILWGIVWGIFLTIRFGWWIGGAVLSYELIKYWYFGHLFLAESMVVYPLAYCLALITKRKVKNWELWGCGFCLGFIFWTLAPLWPIVVIIMLGLWYKIGSRKIVKTGLGFLLVTGLVSTMMDIKGFYNYAIEINKDFYIPGINKTHGQWWNWLENSMTSLVKIWFLEKAEKNVVVLRIWSVIFLVLSGLMLKMKKWRELILGLTVLIMLNIRGTGLEKTFYDGHFLKPWLISFFMLIWWMAKKIKKGWLLALLGLGGSFLVMGPVLAENKDLAREFHVHFGRHMDLRQAIMITGEEGDRLMVLGHENLMYWGQDKVEPASRFTFYFKWMSEVPEFKEEMEKLIDNSEAEYVCFTGNSQGLGIDEGWMDYHRLKKGGGLGELYVREDRLKEINRQEEDELRFFEFEI